jgi:hypothetical protein
MKADAWVQEDWARGDSLKIAVIQEHPNGRREVLLWDDVSARMLDDATTLPDNAFLQIPTDTARALYEALSRHFGGNVVDATTLRKDYDAERARVDLFIKHLTKDSK